MNFRETIRNFVLLPVIMVMAAPPWVPAQNPGGGKTLSQGQLEQMLAPIALYPDSLLAQVLMASTYPVQVVEADRWVKDNKGLKVDAVNAAIDKMDWDASVKALVPFPQVLSMMSSELAWTENLGNAFISQQTQVMNTVQKLRARASAQNKLESNAEQKVIVEEQIIRIEPADPQVIYIPAYNPVVVYGAWPYPAYPPFPYYPVGAVVAAGAAGVAVGAAWNNGWGHWNWHGGNVNVNVNRNININNIHVNNLKNTTIQTTKWQHNSAYGRGAAYSNQANRQGYRQNNYSGRTGSYSSTTRNTATRQSSSYSGRQSGSGYGRSVSYGSTGRSQHSGASAFQGVGQGSQTRSYSSRGYASRQSSGGSFGGYHGGGFSRGGGGGFRRR